MTHAASLSLPSFVNGIASSNVAAVKEPVAQAERVQQDRYGRSFNALMFPIQFYGVDGRYLRRLRDSGLKNLTAAQIEKLRIHGVD